MTYVQANMGRVVAHDKLFWILHLKEFKLNNVWPFVVFSMKKKNELFMANSVYILTEVSIKSNK